MSLVLMMISGTIISSMCEGKISLHLPRLLYMQVRLEWPTDLAINPMDNSIYVLDNNVVLQITENRQVLLILSLARVHVLQMACFMFCFLEIQNQTSGKLINELAFLESHK